MVIEYLDDPERYKSTYAIVMTPAETALRAALRPLSDRAVLSGPVRERIAARLRAAQHAARHFDAEDET